MTGSYCHVNVTHPTPTISQGGPQSVPEHNWLNQPCYIQAIGFYTKMLSREIELAGDYMIRSAGAKGDYYDERSGLIQCGAIK